MMIIKQEVNVVHVSHDKPLEFIEDTARICYKSHDRTKPGSAEKMVWKLLESGHHAMLEFVDITADFLTDRAVTHELVRHRHCSFAQESQRYVRYDGDIKFIEPVGYDPEQPEWATWRSAMWECHQHYVQMLAYGVTPQQARRVLPNSTATNIRVKANLREWMHIFKLRTSKAADPQMQDIANNLFAQVGIMMPLLFAGPELEIH